MRTQLLQKITLLLFTILLIQSTFAQDSWSPSVINGFGNTFNQIAKCMIPFKGNLYAGTANYSGELYRSSNGNMGSWSNVFSPSNATRIDALGTTNDGGGYIYLSGYAYGSDFPKVYGSPDGNTWTTYYQGVDQISHIVPFKGTGSVDSVYLFEDNYYGTLIHRSLFSSNDPLDTLGSWPTIFDLSTVTPYTNVTATLVYGGKLYVGTNNGAILLSTPNGTVWTKNDSVNGFGNSNNTEITALGSFLGSIYVGTYNYWDGAQIWHSSDEVHWTMAAQYPGYDKITDFEVAGGKLWASLHSGLSPEKMVKSADGLTFTSSNNDGFGDPNNHGDHGNMTVFGNNLYYGSQNYGYVAIAHPTGGVTGMGTSTGGQIWRYCLGVPPSLNLGSDHTICSGTSVTLNAGPGASSYYWCNGDITQTTSASLPGNYFCAITNAIGCSIVDTVKIVNTPSPGSVVINPYPIAPAFVCKGNTTNMTTSSISNLRVNIPAISGTNSVAITDGATSLDSIAVSGVVDDGLSNNFVSVTIDSLYHTDDGDLSIMLIAPNGSSIALSNYSGPGTQNYIGTVFSPTATTYIGSGAGPFTGSYAPYDPFYYLNGPTNGTWKIQIYDGVNLNQGFLKGWSLNFSEPDTNMTYSWSPASGLSSINTANTIVTGITTATYSLTVTNAIGCSSTDTVKINVPSISISPSSTTACYGSSVTLTATGSGIINYWSPAGTLSAAAGNSVISTPIVNTEYYLYDTIAGCYIVDSIHINSNPFMASIPGLDQTICFGDTAHLSGTVTGGSPGYTYLWDDGSNTYTNPNIGLSPLTGTSATLTVTDGAGCTAINSLSISVTPSTDIYGQVTYSGGNVTNGNAVIFPYKPYYTHFDTLQVQPLDAAGKYHFTGINHGDYLIKVFADTLAYSTLDPTYFGNHWAWDSASVVMHGCSMNDTADITMIEESGTSGPGFLRGRITEDMGFGRTPGDPIPGVDVHLGKNPGGSAMINTTTNSFGYYTFPSVALNLTGQFYTIYVDIPGLERDSSYSVTLTAVNNQFLYLDYMVDSTMITIVPNAGVGISNPGMAIENKFKVYPNPFKANTSVEYSISKDMDVKLEVYNVLGTKVKTFADNKQQAGDYKFDLNSQNEKLNSGIYFISLTIDGNKTTQRVIMVE